MTLSEHVLWRELRMRRMGESFRRQAPLSGFVVDFFAPRIGLVVEVDGAPHVAQAARDRARDAILDRSGLLVVRVSSAAVIDRLEEVVATIRDAVTTRRAELPTSPPVGENCRGGPGVEEPSRSPHRRSTRHDRSDA